MMTLEIQTLSLICEIVNGWRFILFCLILLLEYLLLEYFAIGIFLYCSMLFYCADVSTIGNILGPSHNPCQSQPRPKV